MFCVESKQNPGSFYIDKTTFDKIRANAKEFKELELESGETIVIEQNNVAPLIAPSTAPVSNEMVTNPKQKSTKNTKIINVERSSSVEPLVPPHVVGNTEIGYGLPTLIRTGDENPLDKMRTCEQQEEEHNVMPPVVGSK